MAKLKHVNLHDYAADEQEVYAALQRDFDRDTWRQLFWRLVLILSAIGAAVFTAHIDWLWIFAAMFALERAISVMIDNSNRNFTMHLVDWLAAKERHSNRDDAEPPMPG